MSRQITRGIMIISIIWWVFPDVVPGPIDDLIAFMTSVVTGVGLLATKAKAAQDAVALLIPDSTTQSS